MTTGQTIVDNWTKAVRDGTETDPAMLVNSIDTALAVCTINWLPIPQLPGPNVSPEFPFNGRKILVCNRLEVESAQVVYYFPFSSDPTKIWTTEIAAIWWPASAFTHYAKIPEQPA